MAKPKIKVSPKDFLLKKGEWLLLGLGGLGLLILLISGVSTGTGAEDPEKVSGDMTRKANDLQTRVNTEKQDPPPRPEWTKVLDTGKPVPPERFPFNNTLFDPVAKPDTKRENPMVYGIENYQVDLLRGPMKGIDVYFDGPRGFVAVKVNKEKGGLNREAIDRAIAEGKKAKKGRRPAPRPAQPVPMQPMAGFPGGPGPQGPLGPQGPRGEGPGGHGATIDPNAQRTETTIEYVPIEKVEDALANQKSLALTVHPIRMVVVNATFPLKKELEEIKRAMRLPSLEHAAKYGPHFGKVETEKDEDGNLVTIEKVPSFEVQRRVVRKLPNGKELPVEEWPQDVNSIYPIREVYEDRVYSKSLNDHVEDGYLPYFIRYDEGLVMPLPELASEMGKAVAYPPIDIPEILQTIAKMKKKPVEKGEFEKRFQGGGKGRFVPRGAQGPGGTNPVPAAKGVVGPGAGGQLGNEAPVDIDHWLIRFVDADIKPGFTYQYRVRLVMQNPNMLEKEMVANPALVGPQYEFLRSRWTEIPALVTVPPESFVSAFDPKAYETHVNKMFGPGAGANARSDLLNLLKLRVSKVKPGIDGRGGEAYQNQAVVQIQRWEERVQTEAGGKQEPIGTWVVAEVPVGRGEYVGRRQYVRLPLWSSVIEGYVLRATPDTLPPTRPKEKPKELPPGWLVNLTTPDILVDFEGGITRTSLSSVRASVEEDSATELLIAEPTPGGGTVLRVKNSGVDMADRARGERTKNWEEWLRTAEARKVEGSGQPGENNPFNRPPTPKQ
jgi:hypothetical protein